MKNSFRRPLQFVGFLKTKKGEVPKGWKKTEIKKEKNSFYLYKTQHNFIKNKTSILVLFWSCFCLMV